MTTLTRLVAIAAAIPLAWQDSAPSPAKATEAERRLPRYDVVAKFVAKEAEDDWDVRRIDPRRFSWSVVPGKDPGPPDDGFLPAEKVLERVPVCPGSTTTLADCLKEPFPADQLKFNRANGIIGEAYDSLYPDAPRLRRTSVPIYADLDRIKSTQGRYVDWPPNFERLAPEEGAMREYPDAPGGPERRWRTFTESNPGSMLKNFEYGLTLRERLAEKALLTTYTLSGPRSHWVKTFSGTDVLTPLRAANGYPAYLMTTVIDLHIEFNVGNPNDGNVLEFMEKTLLSLKARAEKRTPE